MNICSYRSVKGLINRSTTREVGPSGEVSNEYNSCFSLASLRLPRRANLATRLFVRQSSRRRRDRRVSLSDWRRAFTEPDPLFVRRVAAVASSSAAREYIETALKLRFIRTQYSSRDCCLCLARFVIVDCGYYASVATVTGHANSSRNMSDGPVDYQLERSCELYSFIINTVFIGTLVVVGVMGNSFAFVVFWKESIKSSALFLFQCLSLIDSALLLTVFPLFPVESFVVYTGWLQGYSTIYPYVLVYLWPMALIAQTATIWVTVLVAVNRYTTICLPFRASRWCTVSKAKKQLSFLLLFSILCCWTFARS